MSHGRIMYELVHLYTVSVGITKLHNYKVGSHAQSNISYDDDYFSPALLNPPSSLV